MKKLQIILFEYICKIIYYKKYLILLIVISFIFCTCDKQEKQNELKAAITGINIELMALTHLPDFELLRIRPSYNYGNTYVFYRKTDSISIHITVGLHQSGEDAEVIVNNYINSISAVLTEGAFHGVSLGNTLWWNEGPINNVIYLVFIRNNALFIMNANSNYEELFDLAKKIDNDILNNVYYIESEDTIILPVIDSLVAIKTELKEGESTKITVYASDINNENLEYTAIGTSSLVGDPENVFTVVAERSYIPEPFFGPHINKFNVINESNVVSKEVELEIIISP